MKYQVVLGRGSIRHHLPQSIIIKMKDRRTFEHILVRYAAAARARPLRSVARHAGAVCVTDDKFPAPRRRGRSERGGSKAPQTAG
eukprot:COSAG03_NODE_12168_length_558_cov_0.915033_1_plen_84_part_10